MEGMTFEITFAELLAAALAVSDKFGKPRATAIINNVGKADFLRNVPPSCYSPLFLALKMTMDAPNSAALDFARVESALQALSDSGCNRPDCGKFQSEAPGLACVLEQCPIQAVASAREALDRLRNYY